jgi:hypothetical protein
VVVVLEALSVVLLVVEGLVSGELPPGVDEKVEVVVCAFHVVSEEVVVDLLVVGCVVVGVWIAVLVSEPGFVVPVVVTIETDGVVLAEWALVGVLDEVEVVADVGVPFPPCDSRR